MAQKGPEVKKDEVEDLRRLVHVVERRGIEVRREKLVSGTAFKVRSGNCLLQGEEILFLDRRLPQPQQVAVLVDLIREADFDLDDEEIRGLSVGLQALLSGDPDSSYSTPS